MKPRRRHVGEELAGFQTWGVSAGERESALRRDRPRVLKRIGFRPQELRFWRASRHPRSPERSSEIGTLQPATPDARGAGDMHDEGIRFERGGESLSGSHGMSVIEGRSRRTAGGSIGGQLVCLLRGEGSVARVGGRLRIEIGIVSL